MICKIQAARLYKPISVLGRYSKSWIINSGLEWPSGYARKHNFSHPLHAACEAPWKRSFLSYLPHGRCSLAVITSRRAAEASPRSLEVHWQEVSSCCTNNQMFLELVNWYGMHTGRNCRGRQGGSIDSKCEGTVASLLLLLYYFILFYFCLSQETLVAFLSVWLPLIMNCRN